MEQSHEQGGFSIAGDYACTAGHQVYMYTNGGNSGSDGENEAIGLRASLGKCPESDSSDSVRPFNFVNEVTMVAAAYAMANHVDGCDSHPHTGIPPFAG